MAATITANPNPVLFTWPRLVVAGTSTMSTTITWDTDRDVRGRVFVSRNGGPETQLPWDPQRSGMETADIELGETADFRLKRADNNVVLATVTVTTTETPGLPLVVPDVLRNWGSAQGIYNLTVEPGVDSVAMTFRTRQPTNPFVEIINAETGEIADLWARPDKLEVHSMDFDGWKRPLAQNALHTYRIVAHPMPGSFDPNKDEAFGRFRTGSRRVTVFFDKIHVSNDGDPGLKGAGEFKFTFGAGDVSTEERLGSIESWGEGDIDAGDDVDVNKAVTIESAPRGLWAQVMAFEDDRYFYPGAGLNVVGMGASFKPPGSFCKETEHYVFAHVTAHFDIGEMLGGPSETPFQMSTGNFSIAFDVSGRLSVEAHAGEWFAGPVGPLRPHLFSERVTAFSVRSGQSAMVAGARGRPHTVILGPDGAVYHQAAAHDPLASENGSLANLGGRFEGPLTVVASGDDHVSLFGLSPEGAVLHKTHAPDARPDEDWQTLGGSFVGPVTAAAGADGEIELFALDEDGSVSHRTLADPRRGEPEEEWERVGAGIGGSLAALFSPRAGLSLFALGRGGEVLHKRRPPQEDWQPEGPEWQTLGVASDGRLSAEWVGDEVVLLAVVAEDETVRILAWPRYPDEPPREGWQVVGTVNSLLQARLPEGEPATVPEAPQSV